MNFSVGTLIFGFREPIDGLAALVKLDIKAGSVNRQLLRHVQEVSFDEV
ncbi:hypothetical protein OH720_08650 [Pseudomonas sp. WJP1]|nr:hypothetical protein [Pseudomonas sp. WJP1]WCM53066.1 hypothetical protein OH720_08650 [Pseudomonas sp. WJP1]